MYGWKGCREIFYDVFVLFMSNNIIRSSSSSGNSDII